MEQTFTPGGALGQIGFGPQKNDLVAKTVAFVRRNLHKWRDAPNRPKQDAERKLNYQLSTFLAVRARDELPMVVFNSEIPQGTRHAVDIGALDAELIEAGDYNAYDPFLVIECKRLPAPAVGREKEYVTGFEERSGGIQRFRLGLHGQSVDTAILVGYIQEESAVHWFDTINSWIGEFASSSSSRCGCDWLKSDLLQDFANDEATSTAEARSVHERKLPSATSSITLFHHWVMMNARASA